MNSAKSFQKLPISTCDKVTCGYCSNIESHECISSTLITEVKDVTVGFLPLSIKMVTCHARIFWTPGPPQIWSKIGVRSLEIRLKLRARVKNMELGIGLELAWDHISPDKANYSMHMVGGLKGLLLHLCA